MTIQDWAIIIIAISAPIAAIATLLAPSLAEIVKFRINQPKPSPDPNQPENLIQRKGGRSLKRMFWFPAVVLAVELWLLVRTLRSPVPIDKVSVLTISFLASSLLFMVVAMALVYLAKSIAETFQIHLDIHRIADQRIDELVEWLTTLTASLTAWLNNDADRAAQIMQTFALKIRKSDAQ